MIGYMEDQKLPFEHEVERAIIGALMLSGENTPIAARLIRAEDFQNPYHQHIYRACIAVWQDGRSVDALSCFAELRKDGNDRDITVKSLGVFTERVASDIHLPTWCGLLKEFSGRRKAVSVGLELVKSLDPTLDTTELISRATEGIFEISGSGDRDEVNLSEAWHDLLNSPTEPPPIRMGMGELDNYCGLGRGLVTVVGAPPGGGKTAFALNVMVNLAEAGKKVWFVSIEMRSSDITKRLQSLYSGIDGYTIFNGPLSADQTTDLAGLHQGIHSTLKNVLVDDRGEMDLQRFMAQADFKVKSEKVDAIVVDYIGLMQADPKLKSEYDRVTAVSQCLRRTARVLGVPILALSQLRRKEGNALPTMHDLKSTGQIEADAGLILLLNPGPSELGVNIVKNRNGMCREVILPYRPECFRIGPRALDRAAPF